MQKTKSLLTIVLFLILGWTYGLHGQRDDGSLAGKKGFFAPSDTFNSKRFSYALGFSSVTYTGFSIGLWHAWYKSFPREKFHLFNDFGEWRHMDKIGHFYTSYFQGVLCYQGARWTGLSKRKSILVGVICGTLFQSTIEVMDGFSSKWGFSLSDVGSNFLGIGLFAAQQYFLDDQWVRIKVNSIPQTYVGYKFTSAQGISMTLEDRADMLFGSSYAERFLKDYNAQVYWACFDMHAILPKGNHWPEWLDIAVGYGADNMFGGYENKWYIGNELFEVPEEVLQRTSQFYLGFDVDLTEIKTKNPFWGGLLSIFNIFKVPSPAIEINTRGEFTFHLFR